LNNSLSENQGIGSGTDKVRNHTGLFLLITKGTLKTGLRMGTKKVSEKEIFHLWWEAIQLSEDYKICLQDDQQKYVAFSGNNQQS
jgi:hypothetical protein